MTLRHSPGVMGRHVMVVSRLACRHRAVRALPGALTLAQGKARSHDAVAAAGAGKARARERRKRGNYVGINGVEYGSN